MIAVVNNAISTLAGLFEGITCIFLMQALLGTRYKWKPLSFIAAVVEFVAFLCIGTYLLSDFLGNVMLTSLYYVSYYFLFALLFCRGKLYVKILVVGACFALLLMSEIISMTLINTIFSFDIQSQLDPENWYNLLGTVLSKIIFFIAYIVIVRISRSREEDKLGMKDGILLVSVPLASIFTLLLILEYIRRLGSQTVNAPLVLAAMLGSFFVNILVFFFYERLKVDMRTNQKLSLMQQQADLQSRHYKEIETTHAKTQEIWHDMNNHMMVMNSLVQNEDLGRVKAYLNEVGKTIHELFLPCRTGNAVLDALINEKYRRAKQLGIHIEIVLRPIREDAISPMDLCIIIGNALDNAIEACQKVRENPFIHLKIEQLGDNLSIVIHNSVPLGLKLDKEFKTTKKDKNSHGFGIQNIKKALEKHDGSFDMGLESNRFKFSAFIPL